MIYSLPSHFVFLCYIFYFHAYLLIVHCSYSCFCGFFWLLIFVMPYLSGFSSVLTIYFLFLLVFFISHQFLLLSLLEKQFSLSLLFYMINYWVNLPKLQVFIIWALHIMPFPSVLQSFFRKISQQHYENFLTYDSFSFAAFRFLSFP